MLQTISKTDRPIEFAGLLGSVPNEKFLLNSVVKIASMLERSDIDLEENAQPTSL
jgi:hypothetical protein